MRLLARTTSQVLIAQNKAVVMPKPEPMNFSALAYAAVGHARM